MPAEYRMIWTTATGGTGYSVFHFGSPITGAGATTVATATQNFMLALIGAFPNEVQITGDTEVLDLSLTGTLLGVYPVAGGAVMTGTGLGVYNSAAGGRVDWQTGVIVAGRRLTGRTYLVPGADTIYTNAGRVAPTFQAAVNAAGAAFIAATAGPNALSVWSRAHATLATVTGTSVPAKGAILRGRRD